jgi:hypothetical protein
MHPPRIKTPVRRLRPLWGSRQYIFKSSRLRTFTDHPRRRILTPTSHRPQIPFLSPPSGQTWSRLLTTERKQLLKDSFRLAGKYTFYGWSIFGLFSIISFGVGNEILERKFPTPPTWSIITKLDYRQARRLEDPDTNEFGLVDWAGIGSHFRVVLDRLESTSIDGEGLQEQVESGIIIADVGKAGLDISSKSEPWRRGYHTTLMGLAKAAEHLEGWIRDRTRHIAFPADRIIGPSNPDPRPSPPGIDPPLEEDCDKASESPEYYYTKLLTTHGFTTAQRLEGATAYGDWLNSKGLQMSAEELYRWGLDIALAPYSDTASVVDTESGILNSDGPPPTESLLLATTSLAIHYARWGDLASSLPIFLSVLRARRRLASKPMPIVLTDTEIALADPSETQYSTLRSILDTFMSLFGGLSYPPALPTGDDPPVRDGSEICEEAGLMAYIGEVLFTSSEASRQSGLAWTREAVDVSEGQLITAQHEVKEEEEEEQEKRKMQRCRQCLETGLENWGRMVAKLVEEEKANPKPVQLEWKNSFRKPQDSAPVQQGRWETEEKVVRDRIRRAQKVLDKAEADEEAASAPFPFNLLSFFT